MLLKAEKMYYEKVLLQKARSRWGTTPIFPLTGARSFRDHIFCYCIGDFNQVFMWYNTQDNSSRVETMERIVLN